jgi:hypothetical protein
MRAMLRFYHRINTSNMYLKFIQAHRDQRQSNELTRGPPKVSSALSFIGGSCAPRTPVSQSHLFYAYNLFEMKIVVIQ